MARQASGPSARTSEHARLTGPRDASTPRRDALAPPPSPVPPRLISARAWIAIAVAGALLLFLIVFITQNAARDDVAALLAAALAGAIPTAVVGMTRLARLRRANA